MVRQISKGAPELKAGHPPAGKNICSLCVMVVWVFFPPPLFHGVRRAVRTRSSKRPNFYCFDFVRPSVAVLFFFCRKVLLAQGLPLRRDRFQSDAVIVFCFRVVLPLLSRASRVPLIARAPLGRLVLRNAN